MTKHDMEKVAVERAEEHITYQSGRIPGKRRCKIDVIFEKGKKEEEQMMEKDAKIYTLQATEGWLALRS